MEYPLPCGDKAPDGAASSHIYEAVTEVFSCAGYEFTAKGKTVLSEGWKRLEKRFRVSVKKKLDAEDDEAVLVIPDFSERQSFYASPVKVTEHETKPPKALLKPYALLPRKSSIPMMKRLRSCKKIRRKDKNKRRKRLPLKKTVLRFISSNMRM